VDTRHKAHDALHSGESFAAIGDISIYDDFGRDQRDKADKDDGG
jgi:hypothetical protein